MNTRKLVLGSVALIVMFAMSGCYTVFQKKGLDGKPSVQVTADTEGECAGDLLFHGCTHERWSSYLTCPWWEKSVFMGKPRPEEGTAEADTTEEVVDEEPQGVITVEPGPPVYAPVTIIRPADPPASAPDAADVRYKSSEPENEESDAAKPEESSKPSRRNGPGGK